jgi:glycosyltransferase involved in cell wall biosynthesis
VKLGLNGRYRAARLTGVQRFAHGLCDALMQRTDTVLFLPSDASSDNLPDHVRVVRGTLRGHPWEQLELPGMVREAGADLLFNPANSGPWSGARHALMVHDVLPLTDPRWFSRRYSLWQNHALRSAIARSSHVFTSTHYTAGQVLMTCAGTPQQMHVITQGLEPFQAPAAHADVARVRECFGLHVPYFLFVGWGDARKNFELLIAAMNELQPSGHFQLVAVGKPATRIHGRRKIAEQDWLRLLGAVTDEELRALYTGALALCFPSQAEGFGRPPLEALACGTPALVGDYPAAREVLGQAVPILPLEVTPWSQHMRQLLNESGERSRLVLCAGSLLEGFDWGRAADQVLGALQAPGASWKVVA